MSATSWPTVRVPGTRRRYRSRPSVSVREAGRLEAAPAQPWRRPSGPPPRTGPRTGGSTFRPRGRGSTGRTAPRQSHRRQPSSRPRGRRGQSSSLSYPSRRYVAVLPPWAPFRLRPAGAVVDGGQGAGGLIGDHGEDAVSSQVLIRTGAADDAPTTACDVPRAVERAVRREAPPRKVPPSPRTSRSLRTWPCCSLVARTSDVGLRLAALFGAARVERPLCVGPDEVDSDSDHQAVVTAAARAHCRSRRRRDYRDQDHQNRNQQLPVHHFLLLG